MKETATAGAWWILNPDTLPDPDALAALSERLGKGDCQAVGGIQYYGDGRVQSDGGTWRPWFARAVSIGHGRKLSDPIRSEEHTSELQSIMRISYAVFCLKNKK